MQSKVVLSNRISEKTLAAIRKFMEEKMSDQFVVHRFDGSMLIYTKTRQTAGMVMIYFPRAIRRIENIHVW